MLALAPVRRGWLLYGMLLLAAGHASTGMAEGSELLVLWFLAPASLSVWTGLLAPLYWYVFGLAVAQRRTRLATALVVCHYVAVPLVLLLRSDIASGGASDELDRLRLQTVELGAANTAISLACVGTYVAGQILAVRAVRRISVQSADRPTTPGVVSAPNRQP